MKRCNEPLTRKRTATGFLWRELFIWSLDRFAPDLVLVASGHDATPHDSLGRMKYSGCYREMTEMLMVAAERHRAGRLVLVHEGGYGATIPPFVRRAIRETLCGFRMPIINQFEENVRRQPTQALLPHQNAAIRQA